MDNAKDLLTIEMMVKIAAIHKILVNKNIITEQELENEMAEIAKSLFEQVKKIELNSK